VIGHGAAHGKGDVEQPLSLVWIDSREAVIVRAEAAMPVLTRLASDVPGRHRSTGHRRVKVFAGHGARGPEAGHPDDERLEHRRAFLAEVAHELPLPDRVVVLGPGPVRDHLAGQLHDDPARLAAGGTVEVQPSAPQTDRQLLARFRELAGQRAPRVHRAS
jgi:hypothetical protein